MQYKYQAKGTYTHNRKYSDPLSFPTGTAFGFYATGGYDELGYVDVVNTSVGQYVATYLGDVEYPSVVISFTTADTNYGDFSVDAEEIKTLSSIAQAIWEYATRTLTMTWQQILNLTKNNTLSVVQGTTWALTFDTNIAAGRKLVFAVKNKRTDSDALAKVLINTDGLQIISGEPVPASGS